MSLNVIQGGFGAPSTKTIRELLEETKYLDIVPSTLIMIIEEKEGDDVVTLTHPKMSIVEMFGAMDVYKFMINMSAMQGRTEE